MYKSCRIVLHGLCFYPDELVSCCYSPNEQINGGKAPVLFDKYKGEIIPKDLLFSKMKKYSLMFKNDKTPAECIGCFQIENNDWDESEYIDFITLTHFSRCNSDCVYCSNNLSSNERTNEKYKILPFFKYLKNEGILKEKFELHIGGGEFTIYDECEDILNELNGFAQIYIATNAIHYSQELFNSIKSGTANVVISLDCGSEKTFFRIKRVKCFDKVIQNIKKYSDANPDGITMKYIIIPGFNDNINEYKKFLYICKELNIKNIRIDIECRYLRKVKNNINPFYYSIAAKMKKITEKMNFSVEFYSFLEQAINKGIEKKSLKNMVDYFNIKYLHSLEKELYKNQKYYT